MNDDLSAVPSKEVFKSFESLNKSYGIIGVRSANVQAFKFRVKNRNAGESFGNHFQEKMKIRSANIFYLAQVRPRKNASLAFGKSF